MYEGYDPQRIGIRAEFIDTFIELHKKNHPDAKFKIGDKVMFNDMTNRIKPIICEILAVNVQSDTDVEYAITNVYGQLVWEQELEEIK